MKTLDELIPDDAKIYLHEDSYSSILNIITGKDLKAAIRIEVVQVIKDMTDGIIPINEPRS